MIKYPYTVKRVSLLVNQKFISVIMLLIVFLCFGCSVFMSDENVSSSQSVSGYPIFPNIEPNDPPDNSPTNVSEGLTVVWETWQILNDDYVDPSALDSETFTEGAIRGMLSILGDPQTSYVSPDVLSGSFQDVFRGNFEGIGAHVSMNLAGKLVIVSPIEGSPAELAGIKSGDIILEADGESLEGLSLLEAITRIRGPKGSKVKLLVKHLGAIDPVEIIVERGVIPLISVRLRSEPGDKFTHIRISDFYPNTVTYLRDIIRDEIENGSQGIILDLRDNPGGTLSAAVDVASQFVDKGLILYVEDGKGKRSNWEARKGGIALDIPTVVLINKGSASSSEVLAGALQDHKRAKIIGTKSYGKGSVNILRELSNGGGLYITIAHWYTPLGRLIQNKGIEPDIEVEGRDNRDSDIKQLNRATEELENIIGSRNTTGTE